MPNTLCHIGIQAPLSGLLLRRDQLIWVIIACIIPDLPWIVLKCLIPLEIFDPYDLRLYCTAQASLFFCLFGSAALACYTAQSGRIFMILGSNCLVHLILDSLEIKWGNGVHFIAPYSWTMQHLDRAWPEHPVILGLTLVGIVVLIWCWKGSLRCSAPLCQPGPAKAASGLVLLACYLLGPILFLPQLEAADTYSIHTLRLKEARPGKPIAFDRAHYFAESQTLRTFAGEQIRVIGSQPMDSGRVSFRGHFLTPTSFSSTSHHYHRDYRDQATLVGLFMACTLLLQSLLLPHFQARKNNQGPP
ncbi:MAG: hypothetical protein OEL83_18100 [Desulforhopalus sp.]|nr:hypothetical protein [Desulforhopalus sp.]